MSKLPTSRLPVTPSKIATAPKSGLRPPQPSSTTVTPVQQASPTGGDATNSSFAMGDRVIANGKSGTVAFVGSTKFADGEWMGIILDDAQGKNDGSYEGIRYFETETNRGLFCRPGKVQRLVQTTGSDNSADQGKAQSTPVTDSAQLSTSTANLGADVDTTLVDTTSIPTDPTTSTEGSSSQQLRVGDRVVVSGTKYGTLKYLGKIHVAEGIWCGIQLDEPLGKNDGSVSGKRYFSCQQRYGLFSPVARVEKVNSDMTQSQIAVRKASISSSTANNALLHRSTSQESLHSNLSEFSTSSNSISRIPMRTPGKSQPQKVTNPANVYTTPNTKSLLTQAAATLAAVTPSSTQMANLIQTIKEKDVFIEKLQQQREQDRLEFSRAAQQVDEMESRMLAFKKQFDMKESENEQMKKDQYETKQRLEDLEFQLEEYKLTETSKENATTSVIPDGYRLLSPKDIEIYEQIKEKVLELESNNQKLNLEKQTLQDEHRQELKRQNDSNETDFKARLNQLEQKLQDDFKSQQTDQLDTIKSQYEMKLTEKDHQIQISLDQQQQIEQLKSQLTDLQAKEQSQATTLSNKEISYEQAIKETQEIRTQLITLKETSDKQANELKRYQENVIPELEKQCQLFKSDLENRDRTAHTALNERDSHFEQQIKDYQTTIDQVTHDSEQIRKELKQIQEEFIQKDKQNNEIIHDLTQKYEQLQAEVKDREQKANSTLTERESQYEQQIKDYRMKSEQSTRELEMSQLELIKIREDKLVDEKHSNETIESLKKDYDLLKTEFTALQDRDRSQNMAVNERESHYESQVKEYQTKCDEISRETQNLRVELTKFHDEKLSQEKQHNEIIQTLKENFAKQIAELENQNLTQSRDNLNQIDQLQKTLNENRESLQQTEQTGHLNETLKKDFQELQLKYNQLQTDYQQHLTSNEQLKNTNDNVVNEKQALIDQLSQQVDKQERQLTDEKIAMEKLISEKIFEYETRIQLMKSEFLLDTENRNLDHEQEKIRLKNQLQSSPDNKATSNSNTNVKQLEYELTDARYQIENLQKQLAANATKDDRATLEGQVNFLNDVIVDLRNTNEDLRKEIEFQKNPYLADDQLSQNAGIRVSSSVPRLYCDMCEVFDQHDTDDCPKQSSLIDDQPTMENSSRTRVLPPARVYCEKCEQFDHDCNEIDETY